jgi:polyferredoxin
VKVDVIRDRGALARELEDGVIENVYRLQIMNTEETPRQFVLKVQGLEAAVIASPAQWTVPATTSMFVPVRVQVPAGVGQPGSNPLYFIIEQPQTRRQVVEKAAFFIPH